MRVTHLSDELSVRSVSAMRQVLLLAAALGVAFPSALTAQAGAAPVEIRLANGSAREELMAQEFRELFRTYDVTPWVLTREMVIEEGSIPHSHPVLTMNTRHLGEPLHALTTFLHEQLHWMETLHPETWAAAMDDLRAVYPELPTEGVARDEQSTYRHLLVCQMEFQALSALVGSMVATETLQQITHYEWIYDQILSDSRVRETAVRHGFDVSQGAAGASGADSR